MLKLKAREIASTCAGFKLRQTSRAVTQYYDAAMEPCGLKITQFNLLVALTLAGPIPIGILAEHLVMDRTTLTRNAELLIRDGFATMVPGNDRRMKLLDITEKGRAAFAKAVPLWEEAQRTLLARVGKENWSDMSDRLTALISMTGG